MPTRLERTTISVNNSTKERLYHDVMWLCRGGLEPKSWDEAILLLLDQLKLINPEIINANFGENAGRVPKEFEGLEL